MAHLAAGLEPPQQVQASLNAAWKGVASVHAEVSLIRIPTIGVRRQRLGELLSELQFLCGLLNCIFCLSLHLSTQDQQAVDGFFNYAILDSIARVVENILDTAATAPDDELVTMTVNVRFYRDLVSQIATFAAYNLSVLHQTLLIGHPIPPSTSKIPTVDDLGPTLEKWLRLLNSRHYDRTILEWASERGLVQARRELDPEYQRAATGWAKFASTSWEFIEPFVRQLFAMPATNNFTQWAIEHARSSWPYVYGFDAPTAQPVVTLVNDISLGKVTPLHYAAMLGLSDLVKYLLLGSQTINLVNANGCFGTPLFCALVGPRVLLFGTQPSSWGYLVVSMEPADAALIKELLARGASGDFSFSMPDVENPIQLTHVAFVAATILEDPDIFTMAAEARTPLQEDFTLMLISSSVFEEKADSNPAVMSKLVTAAFDRAMVMADDSLPWEDDVVCGAIWKFMNVECLGFDTEQKVTLPFISDGDFASVVRQCVIDDRAIIHGRPVYLERLMQDRRFDPNLLAREGTDEEGTILHLAVSGRHELVLHELYLANADFGARDAQGRTPLMVIESVAVLRALVRQYKVSTTAKNNDGQNIWHLAAATNDASLLKWLCANDPDKPANINVISNAGRTPLAEALLCFSILSDRQHKPTPTAAKTLLDEELVDVKLGTSNLPMSMAEITAQWTDSELAAKLVAAGVAI
ncbi:ankyrin repeat domain protein [Metarhizium album ARSEF 1941]|uniref:Ankyrin repeat domain protein n=1 Tax=Metarhizium album (strain ARSEF 1941) TaxID=1081103 RepID=A0A0B2WXZ5_METAS|nr:ankyrin repeat domain protein [Metarhizium album ARSEF 1941]KHN98469.1 ankyrin repeat domain protein [Metarhizium album ARSEF 1941]